MNGRGEMWKSLNPNHSIHISAYTDLCARPYKGRLGMLGPPKFYHGGIKGGGAIGARFGRVGGV